MTGHKTFRAGRARLGEAEALLKRSRAAMLSGASALAMIAAGPVSAEEARTFDIEAQPLGLALIEYSEQSDWLIVAPQELVAGKTAPGVRGNLDPEIALAALLEGSGLGYARGADGQVRIAGEGDLEDPQELTVLAQAETGGTSTGRTREKIIVTGQKREEYIQDIPIAISAFTQEELTTSQIAGGPDLITQIPNFTFTKTNFSGYSIQIRGIGTQAISATTDPAVAVAFNSTPFIRNRFFEQEFYDLERVEVLRGPQGTLYGRNATAGVVNLISAKPNLVDKELRLSADKGNFNSQRLEAMVNIPLVDDQVALRLAGASTKRDGYATNQLTGNPIDGRDLWSTRASLRFAPNDRLDANLIWEHFEEDDDRIRSGKQLCKTDPVTEVGGIPIGDRLIEEGGQGGGDNGGILNFAGPNARFSQGCQPNSFYSADSFQTPNGQSLPYYVPLGAIQLPTGLQDPYENRTQSRDLRVIESTVDPAYRAKTDVVEFQLNYNLTDNLTLTSETGWATDFLFATQDYNRFNTASGAWVTVDRQGNTSDEVERGILSPDGFFCDPQIGCADRLVAVDLSTATSVHFSQEFRLASQFAGPFNFSVGANYLRYDTEDKYYVFINSLSLYAALSTNAVGDRPYVAGETDNTDCLQQGPQFAEVGGINPLGGSCTYIDPNPIENLNDLGHNYFLSRNPYKLTSYAAFGEAYYNLTDNLKITAGLRWSYDNKKAPRIPSWLLAAGSVGYPIAEVVDQTWREPTGRLVVDWKPDLAFTDETLVYGSFAHGYKAGGANPPAAGIVVFAATIEERARILEDSVTKPRTFEPEFVEAFEVGTKNTLLDGDLTLNAAAFYYDYTDYQISYITDRSAVNLNFDAEVWGAEIEAEWWALENLKLSFKGGYQGTRVADGERAVDVMNRTAGNPDYVVVKPFPTFSNNCVLPAYVFIGTVNPNAPTAPAGALVDENGNYIISPSGVSGGFNSPCEYAYLLGHDPVTNLDYVENPTVAIGTTGNNEPGRLNRRPGYPGFNPFDPIVNGGEGLFTDLSGNELPNAPQFTATVSGDYILPLGTDWTLTLHTDLHYQSEQWARIFNLENYDRIREYYTMNLAAILASEDGWNIMGYVKNVTDETAITGAFLNSDDSGLTTNVFLTEPRLYGVRVTKDWVGGDFLGSMFGDSAERDPDKPYPFNVMVGGQIQRIDAPNEQFLPSFAGEFDDEIEPFSDQEDDLDWGDGREIKLTYRPNPLWSYALGMRTGRTNGGGGRIVRNASAAEKGCGFPFPCPPDEPEYFTERYDSSNSQTTDQEEFTIIDFVVGREVGVGGQDIESRVSAGLRYAQIESSTAIDMYGLPDWRFEEDLYGKYSVVHHRYGAEFLAGREFEGFGPILSWDVSAPLLGDAASGRLNVDGALSGGVLFGRQKSSVEGLETSAYYDQDGLYFNRPIGPVDGPYETPLGQFSRSDEVTVPTLGASVGLSYKVDRFSIGAGYRWERYYDAIDGGIAKREKHDRTIDGPYLNVSVGFGG